MTVEIRPSRANRRSFCRLSLAVDGPRLGHSLLCGRNSLSAVERDEQRHKKIARLCRIPCIRLHGWIPLRVLNWGWADCSGQPVRQYGHRVLLQWTKKKIGPSRFRSRFVVRVILASCEPALPLNDPVSHSAHIVPKKCVAIAKTFRRARIKASGRKTVRLIRTGSNLKRLRFVTQASCRS